MSNIIRKVNVKNTTYDVGIQDNSGYSAVIPSDSTHYLTIDSSHEFVLRSPATSEVSELSGNIKLVADNDVLINADGFVSNAKSNKFNSITYLADLDVASVIYTHSSIISTVSGTSFNLNTDGIILKSDNTKLNITGSGFTVTNSNTKLYLNDSSISLSESKTNSTVSVSNGYTIIKGNHVNVNSYNTSLVADNKVYINNVIEVSDSSVLLTPTAINIRTMGTSKNLYGLLYVNSTDSVPYNKYIINSSGQIFIEEHNVSANTGNFVYFNGFLGDILKAIYYAQNNGGSGTSSYTLPIATSSVLGGIKTGSSNNPQTSKYTGAVKVDSNGNAYVDIAVATTSASGALSSADKSKLDGITAKAAPNQNAFSSVTVRNASDTSLIVGSIEATAEKDDITIQGGDNITIAADATKKTVTISSDGEANQNAYGVVSVVQLDSSNVIIEQTALSAGSTSSELKLVQGNNITLTPNKDSNTITISASGTTYSNATQTTAGLMSAADKTKLDGLGTTGDYVLPTATSSTLGGIKVGYLANGTNYKVMLDSNGNAYVNVPWKNTTYSVATTSADGLMSAEDKTYFDNSLYKISLAGAFTSTGGTIAIDQETVTNAKNQKSTAQTIEIPLVTTTKAGLMSPSDKATLNGLVSTGGEANQNAFSYVTVNNATSSTIIESSTTKDTLTITQGSNITITPDATNKGFTIAATNTTYSAATTSKAGLMSAADKTKLNGIETGAQVNQNAISTLTFQGTTTSVPITSTSEEGQVNFKAGDNIKFSVDSSSNSVTISSTASGGTGTLTIDSTTTKLLNSGATVSEFAIDDYLSVTPNTFIATAANSASITASDISIGANERTTSILISSAVSELLINGIDGSLQYKATAESNSTSLYLDDDAFTINVPNVSGSLSLDDEGFNVYTNNNVIIAENIPSLIEDDDMIKTFGIRNLIKGKNIAIGANTTTVSQALVHITGVITSSDDVPTTETTSIVDPTGYILDIVNKRILAYKSLKYYISWSVTTKNSTYNYPTSSTLVKNTIYYDYNNKKYYGYNGTAVGESIVASVGNIKTEDVNILGDKLSIIGAVLNLYSLQNATHKITVSTMPTTNNTITQYGITSAGVISKGTYTATAGTEANIFNGTMEQILECLYQLQTRIAKLEA